MLAVPPSLSQKGKEIESWFRLKVISIDAQSRYVPQTNEVIILLYSSVVPEEELFVWKAQVELMHPSARRSLRVWSLDGSSIPSPLDLLIHPERMRALSLLTSAATLSTALASGDSLHERELRAESRQRKASTSFLWQDLKEQTAAIERVGKISRFPMYFGMVSTIVSLLALGRSYPKVAMIGFIIAQLILGSGVLGSLWSYFELRGLRQKVFMFWIDSSLNPKHEE